MQRQAWTDERLDKRFDRIDQRFDQVDQRFNRFGAGLFATIVVATLLQHGL